MMNGWSRKDISDRAGSSGDVRLTDEQMLNGEIPPGIRVLDYDSRTDMGMQVP